MPTVWDMKLPLLQREKMLIWIRRRSKIYRKKWTSNKTFLVNRIFQEILDAWSIIAVICRNLGHFFLESNWNTKQRWVVPVVIVFEHLSSIIINISTSENIFWIQKLNSNVVTFWDEFFCSIFAGKDTEKLILMLRWFAAWESCRLRSRKKTNAIQ